MRKEPSVTKYPLERGIPTTINPNRPIKFKITFIHGTIIEGVIPPNSKFTVCDNGDIAKFSLIIDDDSTKPLDLVR